MSTAEVQMNAEDVIDNVSLPGKRKTEEVVDEGSETANKAAKTGDDSSPANAEKPALEMKAMPPKARENRLEQNRKAARESRKRKKVMIEELQRSVIFFSRANGALKQQNDDLTRLLMQAQMHIAQLNSKPAEEKAKAEEVAKPAPEEKKAEAAPTLEEKQAASEEQKKADTVATQAIFESQGFPAAAARAAAQAVNGSLADKPAAAAAAAAAANANLPAMQPGATMQAMANFQQAAAAAMQQAMGQMKGVPGLTQMAATPIGSNPAHAFTDAMTAIAMQQAAAAAALAQNNTELIPTLMNQMQTTVPTTTTETEKPAEDKKETETESKTAEAAPEDKKETQDEGTTEV